MPGEAGYTALFPYVSYEAQGLLYERRNLSTPFLIQTDRDLTGQGIPTCTVPEHFTGTTAAHLLGYLDGEGHALPDWSVPTTTCWRPAAISAASPAS